MLKYCFIIALVLLAAPTAQAAETAITSTKTPLFFEALYDVPVMPGLEELKDQAMLFDKPDGRIASVMAASKNLNATEITRFYAESLPQLGWKKTAENQYVRGSDSLKMEVSKKPPLTVIHFTLSPVNH